MASVSLSTVLVLRPPCSRPAATLLPCCKKPATGAKSLNFQVDSPDSSRSPSECVQIADVPGWQHWQPACVGLDMEGSVIILLPAGRGGCCRSVKKTGISLSYASHRQTAVCILSNQNRLKVAEKVEFEQARRNLQRCCGNASGSRVIAGIHAPGLPFGPDSSFSRMVVAK